MRAYVKTFGLDAGCRQLVLPFPVIDNDELNDHLDRLREERDHTEGDAGVQQRAELGYHCQNS